VGPFTDRPLPVIATQLRTGGTDPVELARESLAAIEASQSSLNAFVTVDADGALKAAHQARDELARGEDRGPLHGVPVAVKDIVDTAGLLTTMGSRHFAGHIPDRDALVVTRLRVAGAVIVGKTTTHEFAFGPTGDRAANGPATNPYDSTRMSGGSSAGSAAAVGAGLVLLAVGSDTGGSVRIPAALCGVTGIRPSMGRIPTDGVFPLSWSLDTVGPLAADVDGTAVGWRILSGIDRDADSPVPPLERLGVVRDAWFDRLSEPVRQAWQAALARLAAGGVELVDVLVPDGEELFELYRQTQAVEALSIHHERLAHAPELFDDEVRQRLEAAQSIPARVYAQGLLRLATVRAEAARRFAGIQAMALPTVPILAPPVGARDIDLGGGWTVPREALLAHNAPFSSLGVPALSLPLRGAEPAADHLPVGLQLVGPAGTDEALLTWAAAVARLVSPTADL
jgi:Asp-tRNA(Asn)/Glu-tRNA(Gln) amidotransferase A subunit family amidase